MDVHPPEHPIHTWRDFFVHIATIVVGLLIAIGLEQSVEALHRRHLLHQAETKLDGELRDNRQLLRSDRAEIQKLRTAVEGNLTLLQAEQLHAGSHERIHLDFDWSSINATAWDTARDSGAVSLMPYEFAQAEDDLYRQAALVNTQATVIFRDLFQCVVPLEGGRRLEEAKPAEIESMIGASRQTLVDLRFLDMLSENLDSKYRAHL